MSVGVAFFLYALLLQAPLGDPPMRAGSLIQQQGPELGAANLVTTVVLAYRGLDTLGELAILFAAATAAGLLLSVGSSAAERMTTTYLGEVLESATSVLVPLLILLGLYIVVHGHLTPGGGFQGGVILATALFLSQLSGSGRSRNPLSGALLGWVEGAAGALFILIGGLALLSGKGFLAPLLQPGTLGHLLSAGTLPLLYLLVGLKVGAELAALLFHLARE